MTAQRTAGQSNTSSAPPKKRSLSVPMGANAYQLLKEVGFTPKIVVTKHRDDINFVAQVPGLGWEADTADFKQTGSFQTLAPDAHDAEAQCEKRLMAPYQHATAVCKPCGVQALRLVIG